MNAVGWYLALLGRYEEAIPLLRRDGNLRVEAAAWDTMAYARRHLGDLDGATADYQESLRLYGEAFDGYNQAEVLEHLATVQQEQRDHQAARASLLRAAELLSVINSPRAAEMQAAAAALGVPGPSDRHGQPIVRARTADRAAPPNSTFAVN
ncbi:tetratricopeptide repeat protein [Streptomyces sp. NPDC048297]|uniref:tetratricopeptide repeat protein n=1 Tax=Streptomyces sp. NPDC048297 TaxID=3365531 RepID=UPI0037239F28